jgi:hypothetical protein
MVCVSAAQGCSTKDRTHYSTPWGRPLFPHSLLSSGGCTLFVEQLSLHTHSQLSISLCLKRELTISISCLTPMPFRIRVSLIQMLCRIRDFLIQMLYRIRASLIPMTQLTLTLLPQLVQGLTLLVVILLLEGILLILVLILLLAGVASLLEALVTDWCHFFTECTNPGHSGCSGQWISPRSTEHTSQSECSSTRSRHWFSVRPDCCKSWFCIWSGTNQSNRNSNYPSPEWLSTTNPVSNSTRPDYGSWPLQLSPTELAIAKLLSPTDWEHGVNSGNQPQSGYGQQYQQPNPAVINTNIPQNGMSQQPGAMGAPGSGQHQHGVYTPPQTNPTGAHAPGLGNQTANNQQTAGNGQGPRAPPPGGYNAMPPGNRLYQHAAPYDPNTVFPHNAQQPIVMQPNIPQPNNPSKTTPSITTHNLTSLRVMLGFPQTLTFLQGLTPKLSRLVEQKLTLEPLAS